MAGHWEACCRFHFRQRLSSGAGCRNRCFFSVCINQYCCRYPLYVSGPARSGRGRRVSMRSGKFHQTSVIVGASLLIVTVLLALLAPWVAPHDPNAQDLLHRLEPPVFSGGQWSHILGTDHLGRDILSRLIYGARVSLSIGF